MMAGLLQQPGQFSVLLWVLNPVNFRFLPGVLSQEEPLFHLC